MRISFFIFFILLSSKVFGQISEKTYSIGTYEFNDPNPLPSLSFNAKYYPYNNFDGYSISKKEKDFKVVTLENDHLKVEILPELGGKIWGAIDKSNGNEFVYKNDVLKFRNIAMRGPWTSGGIEFNFGIIGHHPSTSSPVDYKLEKLEDGTLVCVVGSIDLPSRTQWRVKITLSPNQSAFKTKTTWYNPTSTDKSYYNWMTAAALAKNDLTLFAPGDTYLEHNGNPHPWPTDKYGRNLSNYRENNFGSSKSYHVVGEFNDFFGGYYSDSQIGFGHYSRYDEMPGKKLWIWDLSRFGGIWEDLLTDNDGQYIEYQAGRLFDQYFPGTENAQKQAIFDASRTDRWEEFWFPVKGIGGILDASSKGALNFSIENDRLRVKVNSFIKTRDTVIFIQDDRQESIASQFDTNGVQEIIFKDVNPTQPFVIKIPELDLHFNSKPEKLKRPWATDSSVLKISSTDKLFQKGLNARRFREYTSAKDIFETVIKDDPAHLGAREELGKMYLEQGLLQEAEKIVKVGLSLDTYHPGLNYIAGLIYLSQKDYTNAIESFGWAAHSQHYRSVSYEHISKVYLIKRNNLEALHYANLALENSALNINALSQKYLSLNSLQRDSEALTVLDKIEEIDPLNHFVAFEKFSRNIIDLDELQSYHRSEYPFQTYLELALFYRNRGYEEEALKVLKFSPNHVLIALHKAFLEKNQNDLRNIFNAPIYFVFPFREETLEALKWALRQSDHWKLKYLYSINLIAVNQKDKGVELLVNLRDQPKEALFYWIRGNIVSDNSSLANQDFQKAYELEKENWRYALSYAESLGAQEKWNEGIDLLLYSLKKYNNNYSLGLKTAEYYVKTRAFEKAIKILDTLDVLPYEHAKDSRSIYLNAHVGLALKMYFEGNLTETKMLLNKALKWPESLGVGKPFNAEERVIRFMLALIADTEKAQLELNQVALYSTKQLEPGKKENLLGLYAIELTKGKSDALLFAQHLDKVASNANEKDVVDSVLAFYLSHPVKTLKEVNLSKVLDFIDN